MPPPVTRSQSRAREGQTDGQENDEMETTATSNMTSVQKSPIGASGSMQLGQPNGDEGCAQVEKSPSVHSMKASSKRKSNAGSVVGSIATKRKRASIQHRKDILALKQMYNEEKQKLEEDENQLQVSISVEEDEAVKSKLNRKLIGVRDTLVRLRKNFEAQQLTMKEHYELIEEEFKLDEEEEDDDDMQYNSDEDPGRLVEEAERRRRTEDYVQSYQQQSIRVPDGGRNIVISIPQRREIRLPDFDGDPAKWGRFYSAYNRARQSSNNLDDDQMMQKLDLSLKGKAKEAVEHLMHHVKNVQKIVQVLERKFGRPEFVLNYLMEKVRCYPPPDMRKAQTLIDFGTMVEALVATIESYEEDSYMQNPQLVLELVRKLPEGLRDQWATYLLSEENRKSNLDHFSKFMDFQVRKAEIVCIPEVGPESKPKGKKVNINAATDGKRESKPCVYCEDAAHRLWSCPTFKKLNVEARRKYVKDKDLCFKCIGGTHSWRKCRFKGKCAVEGCSRDHHTLLHCSEKPKKKEKDRRESDASMSEEDEELMQKLKDLAVVKKDSSNHCANIHLISSASLPVIPVTVTGPKGSKRVYALLDSGATCTLMEDHVAAEIGVNGKPFDLNIAVLGNQRRKVKSQIVQVEVTGCHKKASTYVMKEVRIIPHLGVEGISVDAEKLKDKYRHLRNMEVQSCRSAVPSLLIGYDNSLLFAARKILENRGNDSPCAYRCLLGWYVCENQQAKDSCHVVMETSADEDLHTLMKAYWSTENFGVQFYPDSHRSVQDKVALEQMEKYTRRVEDGRWETCLLWKEENARLPTSYHMAEKRLGCMERKMDRDEEFAQLAMGKFADYIFKGYLVKVDSSQEVSHRREWYLPWFFAYHPSKKPRLVFDAAAKVSGKSLNDFLLKGPDLLESLPAVLLRFRRNQIAITADIKEMFHQVRLKREDRASQRILFRGMDRSHKPYVYEMSVLFFGSASSPSSALYVKSRNAEEYAEKYPDVVNAIHKDCYMDDFLSGEETIDGAIRLQKLVTEIHDSGGFPMLKWNSNSEEVYNAIPDGLRAERRTQVSIQDASDVTLEKTLGMLWDPESDVFVFQIKPKKKHEAIFSGDKVPTKRDVTSILMSVFDPLGFLCPVKIKGLVILQSIWRAEIGWDDEVTSAICEKWSHFMEELKGVCEIRIPRKLSNRTLKEAESLQLHVFVDASEEAFAAVVYLRVQIGGRVELSFVLGKARVAPLKQLTVPKMELQAALLGTRMAKAVKVAYSEMEIQKYYFWSDSRTVLSWIRTTSQRLPTFVANRVGEILESSNVMDWRWVPTLQNPADASTRSSKSSLSVWMKGAEFLLEDADQWPVETVKVEAAEVNENLEELECFQYVREADATEVLPDVERFSSWQRLIRATAKVLVAVRKFKGEEPFHITAQDISRATDLWILKSQEDSFSKDLADLRKFGEVAKNSAIRNLNPEINEKGILIMKGRIKHANLPEETKYPPIQHSKDPYVKLLIQWQHCESQHWGQERIINELRKKAWIVNCRQAVRKCKLDCLFCRRKLSKPVPPLMGQLPEGRVISGQYPYSECGLDYYGPFYVKVRRSREKRWGVIFTCLATRAVHLDLAVSMDTSDFLNVLARFINLRGPPSHMWSDNGSNFVGAEREMREQLQKLNQEAISTGLQVKGITWHFLPPAAPHQAGVYERLIGDVKKILRNMLKENSPTEDVLRTLLAEVTGILNSRPLTLASPDPDDLRCLTPNDLLMMKCVAGQTIPGIYDESARFRKSWEQAQLLARQFWERWSVEYLPWLAKRGKWFTKTSPVRVGDIIILLEDNAPRNNWKLGKVVKVYTAKDGQVRFVDVEIAHVSSSDPKKEVRKNVLRRPVTKICPLIHQEGNEDLREGECG